MRGHKYDTCQLFRNYKHNLFIICVSMLYIFISKVDNIQIYKFQLSRIYNIIFRNGEFSVRKVIFLLVVSVSQMLVNSHFKIIDGSITSLGSLPLYFVWILFPPQLKQFFQLDKFAKYKFINFPMLEIQLTQTLMILGLCFRLAK